MKNIYQGQSFDVSYRSVPSGELTGYTCVLSIRDSNQNLILTKTLTDLSADNKNFEGSFTYSETELWPIGLCYIGAEIRNASTGKGSSMKDTINVLQDPVR